MDVSGLFTTFAHEHLDVSIGVRLALHVEVAVSLLIRGAGQRGFWHSSRLFNNHYIGPADWPYGEGRVHSPSPERGGCHELAHNSAGRPWNPYHSEVYAHQLEEKKYREPSRTYIEQHSGLDTGLIFMVKIEIILPSKLFMNGGKSS